MNGAAIAATRVWLAPRTCSRARDPVISGGNRWGTPIKIFSVGWTGLFVTQSRRDGVEFFQFLGGEFGSQIAQFGADFTQLGFVGVHGVGFIV